MNAPPQLRPLWSVSDRASREPPQSRLLWLVSDHAGRPSLAGLALALLIFLLLAAHQLSLPGLHYDEAKEAGLNAMQLLRGQPVTAFRDATVGIGPWQLPLMVQDYIGALNVLLAIPFLAVGGINPVALRWLPLVIAALTLVCVWRVAWRAGGAAAAAASMLLLAVNPSFVFWSRQGIFVTNLTALLFMASLWTGLRWWQEGRPRDLWLTAFLWGLGIYAKLLFVWAIGAMIVAALVAWALARPAAVHNRWSALRRPTSVIVTLLCFALPLIPLILFNIRTGGTLLSVFGNLGSSYYGVDNSAYLANLATRIGQIGTLLRGDHFWYLGETYANGWAVPLAVTLLILGLVGWLLQRAPVLPGRPPALLLPLGLLGLMVAQSAFTVSDLFITHYAILLPLIPLAGGLAFGALWPGGVTPAVVSDKDRAGAGNGAGARPAPTRGPVRLAAAGLALLAVLAWIGSDAWTTIRYHRILAISGGYAAHSDASARLAAYLDEKGYASPVVLDWGLDASLRFLTAGRVNPVEVFGYERLDAPDAGFANRVSGWLSDSNTVFVGPPPEKAVFRGRVEAMAALADQQGRYWLQEAWFFQRSGEMLFIIYRSVPKG